MKKKKSKKLNKSELEKSNFKIYLTSELKKDTNYFIGLSNRLKNVRIKNVIAIGLVKKHK